MRAAWVVFLLAGCSPATVIEHPLILVPGVGIDNQDCRGGICQHNENTDLVVWKGATYLVHRTAKSQILGPNSALHVYRTTDGGEHFVDVATLPAELMRDLRDPHFYTVGDTLYIKALARLPVTSARDSDVDTVALRFSSTDGSTWTYEGEMGPHGWSFWRIRQVAGVLYTAAYQDGDKSVVLYSSTDGKTWTAGATVYDVTADTPLETELMFFPSGRLLALVRTDGDSNELIGTQGRLRTFPCWADPPYAAFTCPGPINGQRLDGPMGFFWKDRLFVVARKHLGEDGRKRTSLFELTGDFTTNSIPTVPTVIERAELPSAGDTSYAGAVPIDDHRWLVTWYASNLRDDETWITAMLGATDIWKATLNLAALPVKP